MQPKSDFPGWGARVVVLLASGAIAMLAFAPPSSASANTGSDIYVTSCGSIGSCTVTVYPAGSDGNVTPISTITGLGGPWGIAVDASGNIYVADNYAGTVAVYPAGSSGNVAPSSTIGGSKTGLYMPRGIALDGSGNIYVASGNGVTVYPAGTNGNVMPSSAISGPKTGLGSVGIALDASGNIYVANGEINTVTVYLAGSNGNVAPSSTIGGSNTDLDDPFGIAVDASGNIYVANLVPNPDGYRVTVYPAGSNGNVAPSSTFAGFISGLNMPTGIAVGAGGKIYVANDNYSGTVTVYPAGSSGNVAPSATIAGPATGLIFPIGIAIGPEQPPSQTATRTPSATPTPTPPASPTPSLTTPTPAPVAAKITASPTSLTFSTRPEGTTSKPQIVTLSNVKNKKQNQTITVLDVLATDDFAVPSSACVGPLNAGDKCKISVTFIPTAKGPRKGKLTVNSTATNPSLTISLKGTGKK